MKQPVAMVTRRRSAVSVFRFRETDFRLEDEGRCNLDVLDASELSHQQFLDR